MKRKTSSILCILILLSFLLANIGMADTYSHYWDHDAKYYISSSSSFYNAVDDAMSDWNSSLNTINSSFDLVVGTSSTGKITFTEGYYGATGWAGRCTTTHTGDIISKALIKFNNSYCASYSAAKKRAVACHEIGHAIGQSHTIDTSEYSIMLSSVNKYYDDYGIYSPTNYDRIYLNYNY